MAITLEEVIGCASLSRLHTAKRRAQTLLSREMADGRARHMLTTFRDMGAEGDRDTISAESEQARLRSSGGRGAAAWLRSMPSSYHTKAPNLHMRVMLQYWLGTISG
jgi:hypothetical protein